MGKLYQEWVVESRVALAHEDTSNEAAAALRKIIDLITLTPENGKLGIVVQGELARLLAVSAPRDQAENFERCLQMVAGARYHLDHPVAIAFIPAA